MILPLLPSRGDSFPPLTSDVAFDLLPPIECSRRAAVRLPDLSRKRPCSFHFPPLATLCCHVYKPHYLAGETIWSQKFPAISPIIAEVPHDQGHFGSSRPSWTFRWLQEQECLRWGQNSDPAEPIPSCWSWETINACYAADIWRGLHLCSVEVWLKEYLWFQMVRVKLLLGVCLCTSFLCKFQ